VEQPNEEIRKRMEKDTKDVKLWDNELIGKLDSELIDFEKFMTTWLPDLDESQIKMIRETNNPMVTFEKVNDKLEFITINRPKPKKEILRIPSVSLSLGEPYITVDNPNGREEIINMHRPKKKTIPQ